MVQLHFGSQIYEIHKLLNFWFKRKLTVFGKIVVIKLLAVSKIVHLLLCLPDLPSLFLKELNVIVFKFLWAGKPDRIKREYQRGGSETFYIHFNTFKQRKQSNDRSEIIRTTPSPKKQTKQQQRT